TFATAEGEWNLRVAARPKRTVVAAVPVPALGWTSVRPVQVPGTVPGTAPFERGLDVAELTRIVRGKDIGDSYNYAPPEPDVLVEEPIEQRLEMLEDRPLRRVSVVHRRYLWDDVPVDTQTRFEQRAGEPFVRIRSEFVNPRVDQRVRLPVPP